MVLCLSNLSRGVGEEASGGRCSVRCYPWCKEEGGKNQLKKMMDLRRAIINSKKVYESCLAKHIKFVKAEANSKFRIPSLDYQRTGVRMQNSVSFKRSQACPTECSGCAHFNTMTLVQQSDVNVGNQCKKDAAVANGGDGKFQGGSAIVGCYCFQSGYPLKSGIKRTNIPSRMVNLLLQTSHLPTLLFLYPDLMGKVANFVLY